MMSDRVHLQYVGHGAEDGIRRRAVPAALQPLQVAYPHRNPGELVSVGIELHPEDLMWPDLGKERPPSVTAREDGDLLLEIQ